MTQPSKEEAAQIALAQKGDKDAYRALVERYHERLFGLVVSMVRSTPEAEDLTQEIFVKVFFALSKFKGDSGFYTWMYRIASNHCLDHLRKRKPITRSLDETTEDGDEGPAPIQLEAPHTEAPQTMLESSNTLSFLLEKLSPEHRLVLTLRELEGYSYEEIAEISNTEVNTVKSRLNRAREALKDAYEKEMGTSGLPDTSNPLEEPL